jgi:ribonuclease HI
MNTIIFTDGSSRGNPGPGGWGAVVADEARVVELGDREERTTNNRMELMACIEALKLVSEKKRVTLYSDSKYVIQGITQWVKAWEARGWKTLQKEDVLNRDLWEALVEAAEGKVIEWNYVGGHVGIAGNERCDEIATMFADRKNPNLYHGPVTKYPLDILNFKIDETKQEKKQSSKGRVGKAYSYLSQVNGTIETHATWLECEKRVKGVKGARFKKALSAEEEKEIISLWSRQSKY